MTNNDLLVVVWLMTLLSVIFALQNLRTTLRHQQDYRIDIFHSVLSGLVAVPFTVAFLMLNLETYAAGWTGVCADNCVPGDLARADAIALVYASLTTLYFLDVAPVGVCLAISLALASWGLTLFGLFVATLFAYFPRGQEKQFKAVIDTYSRRLLAPNDLLSSYIEVHKGHEREKLEALRIRVAEELEHLGEKDKKQPRD
ncbi:MAG: hypothetical protein AAF330_02990 [Pseudomonadota bacterium]